MENYKIKQKLKTIKVGDRIYIRRKSGAIYSGLFQYFKHDKLLLTDVKICSRENPSNWLICPKGKMTRLFKIDSINAVFKI